MDFGQSFCIRPIDKLVRYSNNARTHGEAQIAQIASSIKEFGFTNPVLIDDRNMIIAGEGRVLAAKKLNLQSVPCIVLVGLTAAQKAAYAIADNKLALNSAWDMDKLRAELMDLSGFELDVTLTGFSSVELLELCRELEGDVGDVASGSSDCPASNVHEGAQADWAGMPDFEQPNDKPFRTVLVHLHDQAAVDAFTKAIGQKLTDKTKYVWFPQQVKKTTASMEVVYA